MSFILTTTYAFEGGEGTARYAAGLANALGASLKIVIPYIVPVTVGEMPMPLLPVEEVQQAAKARIEAARNALTPLFPQLQITGDTVYGALADVLNDEDTEAPELCVIAAAEEETGDWMSGESSDILRESRGPVLAVPSQALFVQPKRVCLACDAEGISNGLAVDALIRLQQALGFQVTVLHVAGSEGSVSFEGSRLAGQLQGISPGFAEVAAAEGSEVDASIAAFADQHGMDWLAIAPHHYGFWEGLFHRSHTTKVLHLAHVPLLALHG